MATLTCYNRKEGNEVGRKISNGILLISLRCYKEREEYYDWYRSDYQDYGINQRFCKDRVFKHTNVAVRAFTNSKLVIE